MGVEPTQDEIIAPQTVLKTAAVTGPRAAPLRILSRGRRRVTRRISGLNGCRRYQRGNAFSGADGRTPLRRRCTQRRRVRAARARRRRRNARPRSRTGDPRAGRVGAREADRGAPCRQRIAGARGPGAPDDRAGAPRERDAPARPGAHHSRLAVGDRRRRPLHVLLGPRDGRAGLHAGRDHRAHAVRPHARGGRARARAGLRAAAARAHGVHGAQEPQPAQGRPRGRPAHELRAHAQRRRRTARLPRRRQGHQPPREHGAVAAAADAGARGAPRGRPGHRGVDRLRRRTAPHRPRRRRGARDGRVRHLGVLARRGSRRVPLPVGARARARRGRRTRRLQLLRAHARRRPGRPARRRGGAAVPIRPGAQACRRRGHGHLGREDLAHGPSGARAESCSA